MHDYNSYLGHLKSVLERLSSRHRSAFAACCSERFIGEYEAFVERENWGDVSVVRDCLDQAWNFLQSGEYDAERASSLIRRCEMVTPSTEDFAECSGALNAVCAVLATLESCDSIEPDKVVEAASLCLDTLDFQIQDRTELPGGGTALETAVWNHPDMQREVNKQLEDIELLSEIQTLDKASVARFKEACVKKK